MESTFLVFFGQDVAKGGLNPCGGILADEMGMGKTLAPELHQEMTKASASQFGLLY